MGVSLSLLLAVMTWAIVPHLIGVEVVVSALILVVLAVVASWTIAEELSPTTVMIAAAAAFLAAVAGRLLPAAGAALLLGACFVPRLRRARRSFWIGVSVIIMSGLGATVIFVAAAAEGGHLVVATGVAALVSCAAWLVPVEDRLVHELESLARRNNGAGRWRLERAAALRRMIVEEGLTSTRRESKSIRRACEAILRLGELRPGAGDREGRIIDESLAAHVATLERWRKARIARVVALEGVQRESMEELRSESRDAEAEAEALTSLSHIEAGS